MVLGRLVHYSADILFLSTILAGIKQTSGYTVNTELIPEGVGRTTAQTVLGVGETVFGYGVGFSCTSGYFVKKST